MKFFRRIKTYLQLENKQLTVVQTEQDEIIYQNKFSNKKDLASIIQQLLKPADKVTLLIGVDKLFTRSLTLPLSAKDKIEEIIKFEVLTKLPYAKEDLYYSYYFISEKKEKIKVFVFAVVREIVDELYQQINQLNLSLEAIIPVSIINCAIHNQILNDSSYDLAKRKDDVLIASSYGDSYQFTFFSNNIPIYLRAGEIKKKTAQNLKDTLSYLKREYGRDDVIVVQTREDKDKKEVEQLFSQEVISLQVASNKLKWNDFKQLRSNLKGQDFLAALPQQKAKSKQGNYKKIALLVVLIIIVNSLAFALNYRQQKEKLALLEEKAAENKSLLAEAVELEKEYQTIEKKQQLIAETIEFNGNYLPWLKELSSILAEETRFEQLIFKKDELVLLSGSALSAAEVMGQLDESDYFKEVYFMGSIVSEKERERFRIAGDLTDEIKQ